MRHGQHSMKTILIIILLHSTASVTAIEFDDAQACERAADAIRKLTWAKTVCAQKAN